MKNKESSFNYIEYRRELVKKILGEPDPNKRREILQNARKLAEYRTAEDLHRRAMLAAEIGFYDELIFDRVLNRMIKIRRLEYPPRIERLLEKEGWKSDNDLELLNRFLFIVTEGRYPSYFTFNHLTGAFSKKIADPHDEIKGWISVSSVGNVFFEDLLCTLTPEERKSGVLNDGKRLQGAGRLRLYIFGNKNPTFKEFLREVRRAVEEKEFVKSLPPLEVTAEEMAQYIDNTPSARVRYTRSARPELTIARWGTDILFTPNIPFFGVSSINCRGDREGIEFLSILYSGLAFSGFGDFGGRIMINESEELYQTEEVYKNFNYKWGELAEMMIDLDERRIIFFNPVEEKF